jgi:hypothetical protein
MHNLNYFRLIKSYKYDSKGVEYPYFQEVYRSQNF